VCPAKPVSKSKQKKMDPKLVLALSKTKPLFQFFTKTASFCVLIEPKQKKANQNKLKRTTLYVSTMCSYEILSNFGNLNVINLIFSKNFRLIALKLRPS